MHASINLGNVRCAINGNTPLQELRYRLGMVTMAVGNETALYAARLKPAALLYLFERNPRVKKQRSLSIANDVSVPSAPGREYLDVHDQKAMPA